MNLIVIFFWFSALIATIFLTYSVLNRKKLDLSWNHPRILVESLLLMTFFLLGLLFLN